MAQTKVLNIFTPSQYTQRLEYIQQCVFRALITPLGSVPGRPNYGSKLHTMVSWPISEQAAATSEARRALDDGLDYWIEVVSVLVEFRSGESNTLYIPVTVRDTEEDREVSLTLSIGDQ